MILAVHISDGVLQPGWLLGGAVAALLLIWLGSRGIRDEEIPRIGLLGAAFFVSSMIHVRLGPTSVHLLLNGLVGLILSTRAGLALAVGLLLQALLLGHGGILTIGVNVCVLIVPALLARPLYRWLRPSLTEGGTIIFPAVLALIYSLEPTSGILFGMAGILVRRIISVALIGHAFQAGWVLGFCTVVLTSFLNSLVLVTAGVEDWRLIAGINFLAHLPVAVLEGFILGSVVSFLERARPEMLPGGEEQTQTA